MTNKQMPALEVSNLSKAFGGTAVVSAVSFKVCVGEIVALIGPNGAGKTTCLNLLAGQLRPDAGRMMFFGRNLGALSAYRRYRLGLRRTFQHPAFPLHLSAPDWLLADREAGPAVRSGAARSLNEALGCDSSDAMLIDRLTPGQRHLLEMVRLSLGRPRLLLLDEPTSGMAARDLKVFEELLAAAVGDTNSAIVVTHDISLAARVAQRIVVMNFGKVIADGGPSDVLTDAEVVESYLGQRSSRRLIELGLLGTRQHGN